MKENSQEPAQKDDRRVRRRRVIYVHGFDPASSDRYRRLIARAGANRGGPAPSFTAVASLSDVSEGWRITSDAVSGPTETVFEVLRYEDVVRHWRNRSLPIRFWTGFGSWARFAFGGGLRRAFQLSKGPAGLFFYPIVMLSIFILTGLTLGRLAGEGAEAFGAPAWTSQVGRAAGAAAGLWLSVRFERSFFAHLMLALFDFLIRVAEDKTPAERLAARIDRFADRIVECVAEANRTKVDGILIVGHSLGGLVATHALARAIERNVDLAGGRARIGFLTLGSVAGFIACRGGQGAEDYGQSAARIASNKDIFWVDVSAPRDWFSFGLVDPLLLVEKVPPDARSPLVISAKFGKVMPDPEDKRTKFRAMGLHMKYLGAPDRKGGFDFFAVAAGPMTLAARFATRRNSPKARMLSP